MPRYAYLVRGGPGTGKTTLGLHFLAAGAANGETTLFISLEETESKIRWNAAQTGINLDQVHILDLSPSSDFFCQSRVFLDSITQFRYLTPDIFQFRKQVISFLRFLAEQRTTVIFSAENSAAFPDDDLQYIADGIISLVLCCKH